MNVIVLSEICDVIVVLILVVLNVVWVEDLVVNFDGFMFFGVWVNVYFEEYGEVVIEVYGDFDCDCDVVVLLLICVCVDMGFLIFGIC